MKLIQFNRILLETLFLPVIALLCVSGVLVWQILRAERTVSQMQAVDQNIAAATLVETLVVDEETGVRGYQDTSNPIFLEPFSSAAAPLRQNLQALRAGIAAQHGDTGSLDALEQAHQRWLYQIALPLIAITRSGGNTRDIALNLRAKACMDRLRAIEAAVIAAQKARRTDLAEHWKRQLHHTLEAIVGLALVSGLFIGAFARNRLRLVSNAFQATLEEQSRAQAEQSRTQAALLSSEKLAVTGRLAASIAHEIHNPLDAVVNLLYLMKNSATPAERDEFIAMAQSELARVTQISRAMLGMYRESRTPIALEVSGILRSVLVLLDRQIVRAGLSIDLQLAPNAIVTGFPAELRQVFTNLICNAVEASRPGSAIQVRVSRYTPHHRVASSSTEPYLSFPGVLVAIADTGSGIAAAEKQRLFQPFFTTKGEHGTGLGLWISQGIVEKHNGAITVDTSTDPHTHGTTMTVFLPRGEAPWPPHPQPAHETLSHLKPAGNP